MLSLIASPQPMSRRYARREITARFFRILKHVLGIGSDFPWCSTGDPVFNFNLSSCGLSVVQHYILCWSSLDIRVKQVKILVSSEDCPAPYFSKWFHYNVQLTAETNVDIENEDLVEASWVAHE